MLRLTRVDGGFRGTFRLARGSYRFTAEVTDAVGNRSKTLTKTFRVR